MSSNELFEEDSTVSFPRTVSSEKSRKELTIKEEPSQETIKLEPEMPKKEVEIPKKEVEMPEKVVTMPKREVEISKELSTIPNEESKKPKEDAVKPIKQITTVQLLSNPHKMICCPPKKGIAALGRAFGLANLNMNLWKENFYLRVIENEVGFCVRNVCVCCLALCDNFDENKRKSIKDSLVESQEDLSHSDDEKGDSSSGESQQGDYYRHLSKMEIKLPRHMGVKKTTRPYYIVSEITAREQELNNLPEDERKKGLHELELEMTPKHHHKPWFIIIMSILQLIALIISLLMGGIAAPGVEPKIQLVKGVTTFRGTEDYDVWRRPNVWIGPPTGTLISSGAIYAPCMRTDEVVTGILLSQHYGSKEKLGCCVVEKHGIAGTTMKDECDTLTMGGGTWHEQSVCSKMTLNVTTILKPCCYGYLGNCKMTTKEGCNAHEGHHFAETKDHCSEVFCFKHFCGSVGLKADDEWHFMPESMNQSWRYLASLFFHAGIFHYCIIFIVQWCAGRPIEAAVGHVRIAITYLAGAIGGNLVGSFFDPYLPQVGCAGGVFTLLGISFIECLQALNFRKRKYLCEFFFVILVMMFLVITGFFPFVNNFAHFGGLLFGIPVALAIMPHLCFNRWTCRARRIIFVVSIVLLIGFIVLFIVLFYVVQDYRFCERCLYFSCVPFTKNVCNVLVELQGTKSHD